MIKYYNDLFKVNSSTCSFYFQSNNGIKYLKVYNTTVLAISYQGRYIYATPDAYFDGTLAGFAYSGFETKIEINNLGFANISDIKSLFTFYEKSDLSAPYYVIKIDTSKAYNGILRILDKYAYNTNTITIITDSDRISQGYTKEVLENNIRISTLGRTDLTKLLHTSTDEYQSITGVLKRIMGYSYASADGTGAGICGLNGFYLVAARHKTDYEAYFIGVAYKGNSSMIVYVHPIFSNKISVRATNYGGTVTFNYNDGSGDTPLGTNGYTASWHLLHNNMAFWDNPTS